MVAVEKEKRGANAEKAKIDMLYTLSNAMAEVVLEIGRKLHKAKHGRTIGYLPLVRRAPEADTLCSVSSPGSMVLGKQVWTAGRCRETEKTGRARDKTGGRRTNEHGGPESRAKNNSEHHFREKSSSEGQKARQVLPAHTARHLRHARKPTATKRQKPAPDRNLLSHVRAPALQPHRPISIRNTAPRRVLNQLTELTSNTSYDTRVPAKLRITPEKNRVYRFLVPPAYSMHREPAEDHRWRAGGPEGGAEHGRPACAFADV